MSDPAAAVGPYSVGRTISYTVCDVDRKISKQAAKSLPIVVSFLRACGEQALGILSRKQRQFRASMPASDAIEWPTVPLLVSSAGAERLRRACDRYFDAVSQYQVPYSCGRTP